MTRLLDEAIAKALELPPVGQDAAAVALIDYIETSLKFQLSDEQVAEVERRRASAWNAPLPTFNGGGTLVDIADRDALYSAMDETSSPSNEPTAQKQPPAQ